MACFQNREVSFDDKLSIMAQGLADKNIITMLLIFLVAGALLELWEEAVQRVWHISCFH